MRNMSEIFDGSDAELLPEPTRLEKLEALGYSSEAEYDASELVLQASRDLAKTQVASLFTI